MGYAGYLGRIIGSIENVFRIDLAMDLGTANTLIYVKGKGIVVDGPSVVAVDTRTGRTIAVGREAREFLGRTTTNIQAERPLRDGVIRNVDLAMAMIRGLLAEVFEPRLWLRSRIVIGVPSGITQVEKRAVMDSAMQAGAHRVFLMEEPMAAAMGAGLDVDKPVGNMIVDIGAGTTEVAVIAHCGNAYYESIPVAGDAMDDLIVRYLQHQMHVEVTQAYAENIKIQLGCAYEPPPEKTMTIIGKELGRGGPRSVELSAWHICQAIEEPVDAIIDAVRGALESTPSTLLADIKNRGITLTGGGALLAGLDRLIQKMTGIKVCRVENPLISVVTGCGMAIEDTDRWSSVFVN